MMTEKMQNTMLAKKSWLNDSPISSPNLISSFIFGPYRIEYSELKQALDEIHALKKELSEIKMMLKKIMGVSDENND
jgi:hypothetical protein